MGVASRLLSVLSILLIIVLLALAANWQYKQNEYRHIKELRIAETSDTFSEILHLKSAGLTSYAKDNTNWDELVSFISSKDEVFAKENLETAMKTYDIDYLYVFDANKKLAYFKTSSANIGNLDGKLPLTQMDFSKPEFSNFFLSSQSQPVEFFAAPIQPSNDTTRESKPKGYFFVGKIWTSTYVADLQKITRQKIHLSHTKTSECNCDFAYPLKNFDGSVEFNAGVSLDANIAKLVNDMFFAEIAILFILALICGVILLAFVFVYILKPVKQIIDTIEHSDTTRLGNLLKNSDEFGDVARAVVEYFKKISLLVQYKNAIESSSIVSRTDKQGIITYANDEFCKISGYSKEELIGKNHNIVRHPDNSKEFYAAIWKKIQSGKTFNGVIKNIAKNGEAYYARSVITPIFGDNDEIIEFLSIRSDVTEVYEQLQLIMKQTTDMLTGLPNKQQLFHDLEEPSDRLLVLINITGFRGINESFGHECGDGLLVDFARRVPRYVPSEARLYRVAGDEFAVLFEEHAQASAQSLYANIVSSLEEEAFIIGALDIRLSTRFGASRGSENIYQKCDMAMNYAKTRNLLFVDFDENDQIKLELERSKEVTKMVQEAIKFDFIQAYGQKVVSANDENSFKIETLMRIVGSDGEVISPFIFLQQAKQSKLYSKLTRIMLTKVFDHFKNNDLEFSINFTFEDILNHKTTELLFDLIRQNNMQGRVIVEIVESEDIGTNEDAELFIKEAKELGCKISIDDFGSGYSNFDYILKIGADILKIDGSLIKNIDHDKNAYLTVRTIVSLAKEIGLQVVGEYVHSQKVMDIAVTLGIDYLQGYYLHKPEALEDIR